jgi:ABC-type uncharacterized transport system ATPase subunit
MAEVERSSDRVVMLTSGKVVLAGEIAGLLNGTRGTRVATGPEDAERVRKAFQDLGAELVSGPARGVLDISDMSPREVAARLTELRCLPELLMPLRWTLEDVYLRETEG